MITSIGNQIIKLDSELYVVERTIRERENMNVDGLKEFFNVDTVLRKDGTLYFVKKIETLEYEQITTA